MLIVAIWRPVLLSLEKVSGTRFDEGDKLVELICLLLIRLELGITILFISGAIYRL